MIYAYIRVSTDKQTTENQKFEIYKFADEKNIRINSWIEETISSNKPLKERKLGILIDNLKKDDILICTEVSRLGRSIMEVMSILNQFMEKDVKVYTTKEKYELGNTISSKVLAFAFSLSAEIEKNMISQRTKEALDRKRSEGKKLGRPKGSKSKVTKLSGKEEVIRHYLENGVSITAIGNLLKVNRMTVSNFIKTRLLKKGLKND